MTDPGLLCVQGVRAQVFQRAAVGGAYAEGLSAGCAGAAMLRSAGAWEQSAELFLGQVRHPCARKSDK